MSEDCLTINVFRPRGLPSASRLPVMAWIYGGGFIGTLSLGLPKAKLTRFLTEGSSSIYNASLILAQSISRVSYFGSVELALILLLKGTPIVYASFNYRLGPFGFPTGTDAENNLAFNLGLKDQLAALEWIQANIGAFGGDKTKVCTPPWTQERTQLSR